MNEEGGKFLEGGRVEVEWEEVGRERQRKWVGGSQDGDKEGIDKTLVGELDAGRAGFEGGHKLNVASL